MSSNDIICHSMWCHLMTSDVTKYLDMYVFGIGTGFMIGWLYSEPNLRTLLKQIFFSTTFLDLVQNRGKQSEIQCWFQKHVYQYQSWHQMSSDVIEWHHPSFDVMWCHIMTSDVTKYHDIYVFGISTGFLIVWPYSEPNLRTLSKKIFFHPRVPPLDFVPFWVILIVLSRGILAVPGVYFKAGNF